jgi:hypothetical protein
MSNASVVGLAKIGNAAMRRSELAYFDKQMLIHELIRGSLIQSFIEISKPPH